MTVLRISFTLLAANLRGELQYRANFLVMTIVGLAFECTGLAVVWVMLGSFGSLGGWNFGEMIYLYGLLTFTGSVTSAVFSFTPGFQWLVREGQFDRFLVRPLPPLVQLMTSRLHVPNLGPCLVGVILFVAANTMVHVNWSVAAVAYLVLTIVGSCLLQASYHLFMAGLVFRLLSTSMLSSLISDLGRYSYYPMKIFAGPLRLFLTFILPFAFMGYLPATVLLNRTGEIGIPPIFAYLAPLAGVVWVVPAYLFFYRQIHHYQSSGH